jgi:hypothetical protein
VYEELIRNPFGLVPEWDNPNFEQTIQIEPIHSFPSTSDNIEMSELLNLYFSSLFQTCVLILINHEAKLEPVLCSLSQGYSLLSNIVHGSCRLLSIESKMKLHILRFYDENFGFLEEVD